MKQEDNQNTEMLREYDFARGVRGKYARSYAEGSNVAEAFPDSASVNRALRALIDIASASK